MSNQYQYGFTVDIPLHKMFGDAVFTLLCNELPHNLFFLYFTPCLISPLCQLTPFIASNTCKCPTARTSEQTDPPPSTAPQATKERAIACQIIRRRTNVVASIKKTYSMPLREMAYRAETKGNGTE